MVSTFVLVVALAQAPLEGAEAEAFLREAKIVAAERLPHGVTEPLRLELEHEGVTVSAVWKSVDRYKAGVTRSVTGRSRPTSRTATS